MTDRKTGTYSLPDDTTFEPGPRFIREGRNDNVHQTVRREDTGKRYTRVRGRDGRWTDWEEVE